MKQENLTYVFAPEHAGGSLLLEALSSSFEFSSAIGAILIILLVEAVVVVEETRLFVFWVLCFFSLFLCG
jgi:hypothetical protein